MNDVITVLRYLARLDGTELDTEQISVTTAQHPAMVCDFITTGCALTAANAQEHLLIEAAQVLWNVYDGATGHDDLIAPGERVHAVGLALARSRDERAKTHARFREVCAALRHDGALIDTGPKPGAVA